MYKFISHALLAFFMATLASAVHAVIIHSGQAVIAVEDKDEDVCQSLHKFLSPKQHLFLVCDGHMIGRQLPGSAPTGADAASFVVDQLPIHLKNALVGKSLVTQNEIKRAIAQTAASMSTFKLAGTTLSMVLVDDEILHIANIGDSRVVLAENGKAVQPVIDHTLDNEQEVRRLHEADQNFQMLTRGCEKHESFNVHSEIGWVCEKSGVDCHLIKVLPIEFMLQDDWAIARLRFTRSLGDYAFKESDAKLLSSEPELLKITVTPDLFFVIIASDGVFETSIEDPITNEEAVSEVSKVLKRSKNLEVGAQEAATVLADLAQQRVGIDDISVIVIVFDHSMSSIRCLSACTAL